MAALFSSEEGSLMYKIPKEKSNRRIVRLVTTLTGQVRMQRADGVVFIMDKATYLDNISRPKKVVFK